MDRTTQAILAIRRADASGLPHFADALARNLRADIGLTLTDAQKPLN